MPGHLRSPPRSERGRERAGRGGKGGRAVSLLSRDFLPSYETSTMPVSTLSPTVTNPALRSRPVIYTTHSSLFKYSSCACAPVLSSLPAQLSSASSLLRAVRGDCFLAVCLNVPAVPLAAVCWRLAADCWVYWFLIFIRSDRPPCSAASFATAMDERFIKFLRGWCTLCGDCRGFHCCFAGMVIVEIGSREVVRRFCFEFIGIFGALNIRDGFESSFI